MQSPVGTVTGEGMAVFVQRLPDIMRKMLGPDARLPRTLFTDRGTGLFNSRGKAVRAYSAAVKAAGFKLFWGDDASQQSPDMPDLLLHETAVAWFRRKLSKQRPTCVPWEETQVQWAARARRAAGGSRRAGRRADRGGAACRQATLF